MARTTAPYGSWKSPITADRMLAGAVGLGSIAPLGDDLLWTESRPAEGGRIALVRLRSATAARSDRDALRLPTATAEDLLAAPWSVRSRVHEYGGGALTVGDGRIFFSNDRDRRLYEVESADVAPRALTPEGPWRFADAIVDTARQRLIAVGESHAGGGEPSNVLVAIPLAGGEPEVLVSGHDFYAAPRLSPDGTRLCWLAWNHPHMPWQETELWVAAVDDGGRPRDARRIAGGHGESIFQPRWSPDGVMHFVSDRTGWWNLYRHEHDVDRALCPRAAEFGRPQWAFGQSTWDFADPGTIVATYGHDGSWHLARIDVESGREETLAVPYVDFGGLRVAHGHVFFVGGSTLRPAELVDLDLETGRHRILRRSLELDLDPAWVSVAEPLEFESGDRTAYAFYYPPTNPDFVAPEGERPPLRVRSHGGPTGATDPSFNLPIQYWTSRGFAVIDVNYGGSTGYGRAYRDLLAGQWGRIDVEDCVHAARHTAERGLADPDRLTISGSSAGGYTVLCALTFHDVFRAGASLYGIGDLGALAADTHKFESRYTDWLVAPYPEGEALYRERSPLFHCERLDCPAIFFQGGEDKVVPPNQAERMVAALRDKGVPVALVIFPDEGHGFRKAENIKRALEGELAFFGRILGFTPADEIPPVTIENLASA